MHVNESKPRVRNGGDHVLRQTPLHAMSINTASNIIYKKQNLPKFRFQPATKFAHLRFFHGVIMKIAPKFCIKV